MVILLFYFHHCIHCKWSPLFIAAGPLTSSSCFAWRQRENGVMPQLPCSCSQRQPAYSYGWRVSVTSICLFTQTHANEFHCTHIKAWMDTGSEMHLWHITFMDVPLMLCTVLKPTSFFTFNIECVSCASVMDMGFVSPSS